MQTNDYNYNCFLKQSDERFLITFGILLLISVRTRRFFVFAKAVKNLLTKKDLKIKCVCCIIVLNLYLAKKYRRCFEFERLEKCVLFC